HAPFGPSAEGWRISKPAAPGAGSGAAAQTAASGSEAPETAPAHSAAAEQPAPASPDLDAEGAEERIVPFPVPSGDYRDLKSVKDGVVWVRVAGEAGVLGTRRAGVAGDP